MNYEQVYVVVTAAFVLSGEIVKPGELVQVTESEARGYLNRGLVRPATEDDGVPSQTLNGDDEAQAAAEAEAKAQADAAAAASKTTKAKK